LFDLGVENLDRTQLAQRLLRDLGARLSAWRAAGGADSVLIGDYREHSHTLGSLVRAILPGGREIVGRARMIDDQARLCIEVGDELVAVSAGDIVHLRRTS
jgi:BirA family biotin operon repressor/biotin-[acetyl-CoA-carboxylase] ligase